MSATQQETLARAWDPDGDGDDDSTPEGDTDHSHWTAAGKQLKSVPGKPMPGQPPAPRAAVKPGGEERTLSLPDMVTVSDNGDGLTFSGYAAVYNSPTRIAGWDEDFDEQISQGAFRAVADGQYPVLMFEHGRHPLIGSMPLGRITDAREDATGLWIEARLIDNWLIQPVRDAVAAEAIEGMSFRFTVNDDGETWAVRNGDVPLRTLTSLSVPELGPVVFPAYELTTASVRSALDKLPVIGRPPAGARAATDRAGEAPGNGAQPQPTLSDLYRGDGEALALRGIKGVKI